MKTCTRCGIEKNCTDFQVRKASRDGLTASCKECLSKYDKERANNPKRVEARLLYASSERGRSVHAKNSRDWYSRNKELAISLKDDWISRNRKKRKVHGLTSYAIRIGFLVKSNCEVCGKKDVHAHHDDYDKPMDVRWLCAHHHMMWHSENGEGANAS